MAEEKNGGAAVYVAWTTFKNSVEALVGTVPNTIDRTAFTGQSWGVQSQLLAAFKFLGLINDDGKPTPLLHSLAVPDEQARKKVLDSLIRARYADLFALDLTKTTLGELTDRMGESYKVGGDTREKAIRFFLAAVEYLAIPVSRFLKPKGGGNGTTPTVRRRRAARPRDAAEEQPPAAVTPPTTGGTTRTVTLKSGGTLTVSASIDVFSLEPDDREFVFGLIDKLKDYEKPRNA